MKEKLYFSTIKEGRGSYFVEYRPPISGFPFSSLNLVYPSEVPTASVAENMEIEAKYWLSRYPVPLMVFAFDSVGDSVSISGARECDFLTAFYKPGTAEVETHWKHLKDEEIPKDALNQELFKKIFSAVPFKTPSELQSESLKRLRSRKIGWYVVFLWAAVAPAAFIILEFFGPKWLATIVFIYGLFKSAEKALKMTGKWKKSAGDIAHEVEERNMRHHHFHCKINPDGFLRLKIENFNNDQREAIKREADALNHDLGNV